MSREPHFVVGLDLGQSQDYSALVIVEQALWIPAMAVQPNGYLFSRQGLSVSGWVSPSALSEGQRDAVADYWSERPDRPPLTVPHMQRWPLGTDYPTIVRDVADLLNTHPLNRAQIQLVVDATGVGAAVVDLLRQSDMDWLVAVTIHAGNAATFDGRTASVPKRDLIGAVSVVLEQRRLQIARALRDADALERELQNFRRRITPAGSETMSSWRERDHDDLVLALALAVWYRERQYHHFDTVVANRQRNAAVAAW